MARALSHQLKIFIVENHPDTLAIISLYLKQMGHLVQSAQNIRSALKALPDADPDVFISDIGLPDGSGWDLLSHAHLSPRVYTIAMSGFGMNADHIRSKEAGYKQFLLKPFSPAQLDAILKDAVSWHSPGPKAS
jgi:DNA-binding response OmpR family regulator